MADGKFVAYYRVSTGRQGRSGLGLEAQKKAVGDWLNGGDHQLIEEFTEVETGTNKRKRPVLDQAIAACKKQKATLVVAKLDRLSRNATFLLRLRDSSVEFKAVDMPEADRFTIGIMALVAERTAEIISKDTKAALAASKARGTQLGANGIILGQENKKKADAFAAEMKPIIIDLRKEGFWTLRDTAAELNKRGIKSARGASWHAPTVKALLDRLGLPKVRMTKR